MYSWLRKVIFCLKNIRIWMENLLYFTRQKLSDYPQNCWLLIFSKLKKKCSIKDLQNYFHMISMKCEITCILICFVSRNETWKSKQTMYIYLQLIILIQDVIRPLDYVIHKLSASNQIKICLAHNVWKLGNWDH